MFTDLAPWIAARAFPLEPHRVQFISWFLQAQELTWNSQQVIAKKRPDVTGSQWIFSPHEWAEICSWAEDPRSKATRDEERRAEIVRYHTLRTYVLMRRRRINERGARQKWTRLIRGR